MVRLNLCSCLVLAACSPMTASPTRPDFDAVWDYSDPAGTEARMREILADTEETAGLGYRTELVTQIARWSIYHTL